MLDEDFIDQDEENDSAVDEDESSGGDESDGNVTSSSGGGEHSDGVSWHSTAVVRAKQAVDQRVGNDGVRAVGF